MTKNKPKKNKVIKGWIYRIDAFILQELFAKGELDKRKSEEISLFQKPSKKISLVPIEIKILK